MPSNTCRIVDSAVALELLSYGVEWFSQTSSSSAHAFSSAERLEPSPINELEALAPISGAQVVWVSPLTRALQTALVGLQPLLTRRDAAPPPIRLKPAAREKKNLGGRDTTGAARGKACGERALAELARLRLPDFERDAVTPLDAVVTRIDYSEAERRWWTATVESKRSVRRRVQQLLSELAASPDAVIVVVGHSL